MPQAPGDVAALCESRWLQLPWPAEWSSANIAHKETIPILIAIIACWGAHWKVERVLAISDNTAVVYTINKGSANDPHLKQVLHSLYFFCATFDLTYETI